MASTRHPPPLRIYQDPPGASPPPPPSATAPPAPSAASAASSSRPASSSSSSQPGARPKSQRKQLQPSPMPLQPLGNSARNNRDLVLNPPSLDPFCSNSSQSPIKHQRRTSAHLAHNSNKLEYLPITAPKPARFPTDSPAKKPLSQEHHQARRPLPPPSSRLPLFTTFPSVPTKPSGARPGSSSAGRTGFHQENFSSLPPPPPRSSSSHSHSHSRSASASSASASSATASAASGMHAPAKRRLTVGSSDMVPASKKLRREELEQAPPATPRLPEPHEMPPVEDDGSKPPYSYAILIGMAILRATNRRLTLSQIYKWISDNFAFYRAGDFGWQNSIRHNLSLHKAFIKQERPKDDPGKGHYWVIEPGMEGQFLKDKPFRKAPIMSTIPATQHQPVPPLSTPKQPDLPPPSSNTGLSTINYIPSITVESQDVVPASNLQDLSSDATLPASDPALQEDDVSDEQPAPSLGRAEQHFSSPLQAMRSSPPVAPRIFHRQATPPTPSRPTSSSAGVSRSKRRNKPSSMNDSGYYSSLESSAMRPRVAPGHILTSELDIEPPRIKRGRAEEEIARIRSSSHDISPMRLGTLRDSAQAAIGSSPLRNEYISIHAAPLTPAIKFKKPVKPPPFLSPNTNLQNHRRKIQQMVNSPIKRLGLGEDLQQPWSPAFNIHDEVYTPNDNLRLPFDPFSDQFLASVGTPPFCSPEKRSAKGDGLGAGVLTDITALSANTRLKTPIDKSKAYRFQESPCKRLEPNRYNDASNDELFSFNLFSEDGAGDVDGVDLLQGFEKIGQPKEERSPKQFLGKAPRSSHGPKGGIRF
ncbi:forkhead box protein [Nannizzia gypsea CBS 118893]|uniref:Forkhead box protein n=1 Tax=Arthroderma gypseum (strain ATCC MYA-4604 / CBS 118893) TaxID=535722 RepID=E4UV04_ARTGP|nr:forkhead box protein [Nannizzia gypsea CBS 118893]EFR01121.1 forkhead box protein [Nannizzia gypsea CBS 118893]